MALIRVAPKWIIGSLCVNFEDLDAVYFILMTYFHDSHNLMDLSEPFAQVVIGRGSMQRRDFFVVHIN